MNPLNSPQSGKPVRNFVRLTVQLEAAFKIAGDVKETIYRSKVRDLSRGGMCLQIDDNKHEILEKIGNRLPTLIATLTFIRRENEKDLPEKTEWMGSHACWLVTPSNEDSPILIGLKFDDLKLADAEKIHRFIANLLHEKGDRKFEQKKQDILSRIRKKAPNSESS